MSSCSIISYTQQQNLIDYYKQKLEETKKEEPHNIGEADHISSMLEAQKQALEANGVIHQARAVKKASRIPIPGIQVGNSPIKIYDMGRKYTLLMTSIESSKLLADEAKSIKRYNKSESKKNECAEEAFKNLKRADQFFRDFCQVPPVATPKQEMKGYVNDQDQHNNACWDGLVFRFGTTDEDLFKNWTDVDITLHEVGHAVTTFTTDFIYKDQSGALNESISDVFTIMYKHKVDKVKANDQNAEWDFAKIVKIDDRYYPLRSLSKPGSAYKNHPLGSDTQVSHMRDYVPIQQPDETNDFGGVHDYSGIPNHAFYLAAIKIQGYTYEEVGKIWWQAMQKCETSDGFKEFAQKTIEAAKEGNYNSNIVDSVRSAWHEVGVDADTKQRAVTAYKKITSNCSLNQIAGLACALGIGATAVGYYYNKV